jgi:ectoine hydroxylase-related dioxygenase (phytanoyl-CoA dioxygenase family)
MTIAPYQRGDGVLFDYRLLHSGLPNQGAGMRPILYMAYSRTWFFDETNYRTRRSVDISPETLLALPEPARHLLYRAYAEIMRSRQTAERQPNLGEGLG